MQSGGGSGPMKPGNLLYSKVLIPADFPRYKVVFYSTLIMGAYLFLEEKIYGKIFIYI